MNILYVTPLVRGFEDILKGDKEAKGLPTFILPLKQLIEDGNDIDIILISNYKEGFNINVDWITEKNIIANINNDLVSGDKISRFFNTIKSFVIGINTVKKSIKNKKYDLIYCHGTAAVIGNIVANWYKVPCAYRLYGTYEAYQDIQKYGKIVAAIKNYKLFLIFKLKKAFMLMTDDGSCGDKVYKIWGRKHEKYPFHFWVNGVDIERGDEIEDVGKIPQCLYLFMAGRVEEGKGQKNGAKILIDLHKKGIKVHLYIAGHIDDIHYVDEIKEILRKEDLLDYIHFMGPISRRYLKKMSYYSLTSILCQKVSNNGSVFYEMFSSGALITAIDSGALSKYSTPNKNIFIVKDIASAVNTILKINDMTKDVKKEMQESAIQEASDLMKSWKVRIDDEVKVIYNYEK